MFFFNKHKLMITGRIFQVIGFVVILVNYKMRRYEPLWIYGCCMFFISLGSFFSIPHDYKNMIGSANSSFSEVRLFYGDIICGLACFAMSIWLIL